MITSEQKGDGRLKSRLKEIVLEKEMRTGRRIPQKEIVDATGLNPNTVSRWMSPMPITRVDEEVILPLCRWAECQIGDLLYIDYNAN